MGNIVFQSDYGPGNDNDHLVCAARLVPGQRSFPQLGPDCSVDRVVL